MQIRVIRGYLKSTIRNPQSAIDFVLFVASLSLYTLTLAPFVLSADNGEFQLVAWKLGIAHPPGYPLYTLVGFVFSRFFASPAFALNLLNAILAAITLVVVSRIVRAATGSTMGGLAAAVILGTSTTFWAQATTANIRMPTALFTAWCVYTLVSFHTSVRGRLSASGDASYNGRDASCDVGGDSRTPPKRSGGGCRRHLVQFAALFSLGLGHHPSILFPGIFFIVYLLLVDPSLMKQPRRWSKPMAAFLASALVVFYLPIRGAIGGTLASGESTAYLTQPDKFLDHVLARGFEGDFFYFVNTRPDQLGDRVALLPTLFNFQYDIGALVFAAIGVAVLAWRNWRLLVLLLGGIATHTFVTLAYRAPQTVEYLMPAYVLFAILVGCGIGFLLTNDERRRTNEPRRTLVIRLSSFVKPALASLALLTGLARGLDNLPSYAWLSQHEDTRQYAESLLQDAPPDAIILSNWHWANPMWYLQQVEGLRPDVDVIYVFPRGEALPVTWLKEIDATIGTGHPVIVNMFFREEFAASPYFFEPIGREAYLVRQSPREASNLSSLPVGFTPLAADFASRFKLLGYRLLDTSTSATEPLTLFLAWRVETQSDRDFSFFVHLVDSTGRVIGQSDRALPTTRYKPGDVIVERFFIAPLPDVPPGEYALVAGIYSTEAGSIVPLTDRAHVAQANVEPTVQLTTQPPDPAIALSHGIYFLGAAPTRPHLHTLTPGSRLTLDLRFLATRPLTRDFVVSVQMIGEGYSWTAASDSVPALGAIPTLKWIAGSDIIDRHALDVPLDAPPGRVTVSLILYDNFTQQPLALLDEQLIRQGPAIPIGAWNIVSP